MRLEANLDASSRPLCFPSAPYTFHPFLLPSRTLAPDPFILLLPLVSFFPFPLHRMQQDYPPNHTLNGRGCFTLFLLRFFAFFLSSASHFHFHFVILFTRLRAQLVLRALPSPVSHFPSPISRLSVFRSFTLSCGYDAGLSRCPSSFQPVLP